MITAHLLRVFTDTNGDFGDKASIIIDEGKNISDAKRQIIAKELNTGETIFINKLSDTAISVMHPQGEIGFAGVGVLGTACLLEKLVGKLPEKIKGRDGDISIRKEGNIFWVSANSHTLPKWNFTQLENVLAVENVKLQETEALEHTMMWAWIDENKGLIRARTFAKDWEIPEAEGNGSGAMLLANILDKRIEIKHGKGSVIFAKPTSNISAEIGGRVVEEKVKRF